MILGTRWYNFCWF